MSETPKAKVRPEWEEASGRLRSEIIMALLDHKGHGAMYDSETARLAEVILERLTDPQLATYWLEMAKGHWAR